MNIKFLSFKIRNRIRRELSIRLCRRNTQVHFPRPVISFTFDDFPRSALICGGDIIRAHGGAATYYVSLGLMGTTQPTGAMFVRGDLEGVIAGGHELGCHTYDHCNAWNTASRDFELSIVKNMQGLQRFFPCRSFKTMSYPISVPRPAVKACCDTYFVGCRSGGQSFNRGTTDLLGLNAFFLEQSREDARSVKLLIDGSCHAGGWLIFATHDVTENPTQYGCTPRFFEEIVRYAANLGARILPVCSALNELNLPKERTVISIPSDRDN